MVEKGGQAKKGGVERAMSLDLSEFQDCYDEAQWWHYQTMADNAKRYAEQNEHIKRTAPAYLLNGRTTLVEEVKQSPV
jgi:hypothetical protein